MTTATTVRNRPMSVLATTAALALLGACATPADQEGSDPDRDQATDPDQEATEPASDGGDEGPATAEPASGVVGELDLANRCENRRDGFAIRFPAGWHTSAPEAAGGTDDGLDVIHCRAFDPERIEADPGTEFDLSTAVVASSNASVTLDDLLADRDEPTVEIHTREPTEVAGHDAALLEGAGTGVGMIPDGVGFRAYHLDLDDRIVSFTTYDVGQPDFATKQAVLEEMVATVEPIEVAGEQTGSDGSAAGERTLIAEHHVQQRNFRVHAFTDHGDTCVRVEATLGADEDCRPLDDGLQMRTLSVDGEEYLVGLLHDERIADIELVTDERYQQAADAYEVELVEIFGESGMRAFAPVSGPVVYEAAIGLDADGDEVTRVTL